MLEFAKKYGANHVYSQFGEEGLLIEILKRLDIESGHAVEIGANNGKWCSNTALLIENGWTCKMVEADFNLWQTCAESWKGNDRVTSQCSMVDKYNVNAFVDETCVVFSTDTDGSDYDIFEALKAKPAIVIIEVDSSIPPHEDRSNVEGGASYLKMLKLAIKKGYFLVCHTGNLVLVAKEHRSLFPEIKGDGIQNIDKYFNRSWQNDPA